MQFDLTYFWGRYIFWPVWSLDSEHKLPAIHFEPINSRADCDDVGRMKGRLLRHPDLCFGGRWNYSEFMPIQFQSSKKPNLPTKL